MICLQWYILVLTLRLAVYTLFGKNKIKFGQKFFAFPKLCTPVHLSLLHVQTEIVYLCLIQAPL